ncbi:hypothetical protein AVEN_224266-1 [Araneus ventricosus]|uniref:Costars domain-containing protein n=1 Tax=Araneus ventricosus TaxID=182803 RepID=A0A4Y2PDZ3_ARAVE|nr:hypothetical protein AVEN_224266-1 [Araneus ventricosus]
MSLSNTKTNIAGKQHFMFVTLSNPSTLQFNEIRKKWTSHPSRSMEMILYRVELLLFKRKQSSILLNRGQTHFAMEMFQMTQKWDKSDPRYGKPGRIKTEKREYGASISNEVLFLCEMITKCGVPNEDTQFQYHLENCLMYTAISNKVVGLLLRARKHGLVYFEGEMLYQRRDDNVIITLLKPIDEICPNRVPMKRKHDDGEEQMSTLSPEDY